MNQPDIVVTYEDPAQNVEALLLANTLRHQLPQYKILNDFTSAKLKRQHSNALKSGCRYIVTLNRDGRRPVDLAANTNETLTADTLANAFLNKTITAMA